jgi:hypothetical protein
MTGKCSRTTSPARSLADVEQGIPKTEDSGPANNEQVFLLNSFQQAIPPKDFFVEIRGILDVEHLLDNAIVILDATETEMDSIIKRVVAEINPTRDNVLYADVEPKIFSYSDFSDLRGTYMASFCE